MENSVVKLLTIYVLRNQQASLLKKLIKNKKETITIYLQIKINHFFYFVFILSSCTKNCWNSLTFLKSKTKIFILLKDFLYFRNKEKTYFLRNVVLRINGPLVKLFCSQIHYSPYCLFISSIYRQFYSSFRLLSTIVKCLSIGFYYFWSSGSTMWRSV